MLERFHETLKARLNLLVFSSLEAPWATMEFIYEPHKSYLGSRTIW